VNNLLRITRLQNKIEIHGRKREISGRIMRNGYMNAAVVKCPLNGERGHVKHAINEICMQSACHTKRTLCTYRKRFCWASPSHNATCTPAQEKMSQSDIYDYTQGVSREATDSTGMKDKEDILV